MFRAVFVALLISGAGLFTPAARADAPSPAGSWLTASGETVVTISPCNLGYCGRISGMAELGASQPEPRDWRGRPQCGDVIIAVAPTDSPNQWHGRVTDPRDGTVWQATLTLRDGLLYLRGYVGLPIFGETQAWTAYRGTLSPDCRLSHG